jgi:Uma2 family endonuclease
MSNVRTNRLLTYADYAAMPEDGKRYELLDGILFEMAAPSKNHQVVLAEFGRQLGNLHHYLGQRAWAYFIAPFDVRLPSVTETPEGSTVVVQPDAMIVDGTGLNSACQTGAPIFVVEILSPSSQNHDRVRKLKIYEDRGVNEYWIVDAEKMAVEIYRRGVAEFDAVECCDFKKPQAVLAVPGVMIVLPFVGRLLDPNFDSAMTPVDHAAVPREKAIQDAVLAFHNLSPEEQARMRKLLDS